VFTDAQRKAYRATAAYRESLKAYRAERKRLGICRQCPGKAERYTLCLACRLRAKAIAKPRIKSIPLDESAQSV
jgi:hypothetical protein